MTDMKVNYMTADPIVNKVISRIQARSEAGMQKYGVTMERKDTTTIQWLRHAQEEAMDLACYLERCIIDLESQQASKVPSDVYHYPVFPQPPASYPFDR